MGEGEHEIVKDGRESRFTEVKMAVDHAKQLMEKAINSYSSVMLMLDKTMETEDAVQRLNSQTFNNVQQLKHYTKYGGTKHDNSAVDNWITEARAYLNAVKERGNQIEKQYLRGSSDYVLVYP